MHREARPGAAAEGRTESRSQAPKARPPLLTKTIPPPAQRIKLLQKPSPPASGMPLTRVTILPHGNSTDLGVRKTWFQILAACPW